MNIYHITVLWVRNPCALELGPSGSGSHKVEIKVLTGSKSSGGFSGEDVSEITHKAVGWP